jgi:uncharacterized protein (DUF488 family)
MQRVWTIGHSTRALDDLVALLHAHAIAHLVDVRTVPHSRRHPQFDRDQLRAGLAVSRIAYTHLSGLGGRRTPTADSVNGGWRDPGFRGYADHMLTSGFAVALDELRRLAAHERVTIMCAEAAPSRCHRSLLADALVARGDVVLHIHTRERAEPHVLTAFAHLDGPRVTYPPRQGRLPLVDDATPPA